MPCDNPYQRSQRTAKRDNAALVDYGANPISAMLRHDTNALRCCPHCGSESIYRWGKSETGVPRGRCRACERTFSPRTGTWIAGVREAQKFAYVLNDMLTQVPGSCRRLANILVVDKMTVWHWRRRISQAFLGTAPMARAHPVEGHDKPLRESRKGSREWVDHHRDPTRHPPPNRPRWVDVDRHGLPLPHALVAYQLRVLITAAEGGCQPIVVPLVCPSAARHFCDACETITHHGRPAACRRSIRGIDSGHAEEAAIQSAMDGRIATNLPASHNQWSMELSKPPQHAAASRAEPGISDCRNHAEKPGAATSTVCKDNDVLRSLQQPTLNSLAASFEDFLRSFAGPAAKYLEAYAAWFIKRLEGSEEDRLERAWMLLMA